jgi:hypothetical protein
VAIENIGIGGDKVLFAAEHESAIGPTATRVHGCGWLPVLRVLRTLGVGGLDG